MTQVQSRHAARRFPWNRRVDVSPLAIALQPIIDVSSGHIVAAEALARFKPGGPGVEQTFALAHDQGHGIELELSCLQAALTRRDDLPHDVWLTVNLSPEAAAHPQAAEILAGDLHGVVLEITEQRATSLDDLRVQLADYRSRGARIAVDDIGNGHAGLSRLAWLRPEVAKLDRAVVAQACVDDTMATVLEAVVALTRRLNITLLAEGVETLAQLETMARMGIDFAQGYAVARPAVTLPPLNPGVVDSCLRARAHVLDTYKTGGTSLHGRSLQLSSCRGYSDLGIAIGGVARDLDVDTASVSILTATQDLLEVAGTQDVLDRRPYALADFPATALALESGRIGEAHLDDPTSDPAECRVLRGGGYSSTLLIPLVAGHRRLGIIELFTRSPRRWSAHDIGHARTLADHVAAALLRLDTLPVLP